MADFCGATAKNHNSSSTCRSILASNLEGLVFGGLYLFLLRGSHFSLESP
jgi:hypothetical protein